MSPKPLFLSAVAALLVLGAASHAQAQTIVRCNIPFDFSVGGESFPAGLYTLSTSQSDPALLIARSGAANVARFLSVQRNSEPIGSQTLLKFTRYANQYFLASVLVAGDGVSFHVPRSAAERQLVASNNVGSAVTVVVAHQ